MKTNFNYNDGGRAAAGFKGTTGDCAVRAIAIVTGKPYKEVYGKVNELAKSERTGKRKRGISNARTGVYKGLVKRYMISLGYKWTPTMLIGQGCKTHLSADELPPGRILCNVSKHYVAVIDGVVNDTFDSSRGGKRCVYGYYSFTGIVPDEPKKEITTKPKIDKDVQNLDKLLAAKKRWTSKFKRADNAIKKLNKKIKYYEKKLAAK